MLEILIPIILFVVPIVCAFVYLITRDVGELKNELRISDFSRFSVQGFSPKRMAYLLVMLSALLTPIHWWVDFRGDGYLAMVTLACFLCSLFLGFFIPKTDKFRFLPASLGVVVFLTHSLLCKM